MKKKFSRTFLWVSKFDVKLGVGFKIFKFTAGRGLFYFWVYFLGWLGAYNLSFGGGGVPDFVYFSFFNFRLGTYNFPSGSSAPSLKRPKACASAQREFCIRKCLEDFQFTGGNSPKKIPENVLSPEGKSACSFQ